MWYSISQGKLSRDRHRYREELGGCQRRGWAEQMQGPTGTRVQLRDQCILGSDARCGACSRQYCIVSLKTVEDLKSSHHKKYAITCVAMNVSKFTVVMSQYIHVTNHCVAHLKLIQCCMSIVSQLKTTEWRLNFENACHEVVTSAAVSHVALHVGIYHSFLTGKPRLRVGHRESIHLLFYSLIYSTNLCWSPASCCRTCWGYKFNELLSPSSGAW